MNVRESATGLTMVAGTITDVSHSVAITSDEITRVQKSAEELAALSVGLKGMLGRFKV